MAAAFSPNRWKIEYSVVQDCLRDGDLLLWRPCSLPGRLIASLGRGEYSHADMAVKSRNNGCWYAVGMLQWYGGRKALLSKQVAQYPGKIDWYRADDLGYRPHWDRQATADKMLAFIGAKYGWWSLISAALRHSLLLRFLLPPLTDDQLNGTHPPFCSQAISLALWEGGVDPVPNLAHCVTEPSDLARNDFYRYQGTLV